MLYQLHYICWTHKWMLRPLYMKHHCMSPYRQHHPQPCKWFYRYSLHYTHWVKAQHSVGHLQDIYHLNHRQHSYHILCYHNSNAFHQHRSWFHAYICTVWQMWMYQNLWPHYSPESCQLTQDNMLLQTNTSS